MAPRPLQLEQQFSSDYQIDLKKKRSQGIPLGVNRLEGPDASQSSAHEVNVNTDDLNAIQRRFLYVKKGTPRTKTHKNEGLIDDIGLAADQVALRGDRDGNQGSSHYKRRAPAGRNFHQRSASVGPAPAQNEHSLKHNSSMNISSYLDHTTTP